VVNDHTDDEDVLLLITDKSCVVIRVVLVVCCELIVYIYESYFAYIVALKCLEIRRILKQMFQIPPRRMKKKKMRNW